MNRRVAFAFLLVVIVSFLGLKLTTRPIAAQAAKGVPTTVKLASGLIVEEVRVGSSCVVVVSRGGPGEKSDGVPLSDELAAVPCRP
jgi:hypothetical protein